MKFTEENTPPSSVIDDEIEAMDEEGVLYYEEVEEIDLDDLEQELLEQEEEDIDMDPPEDHSSVVFDRHNGSVFCCDIHPNGKIAVTGGEDDKAYVWNVETGDVVMDCSDFKDSITYVGFSADGAYLATADMSGVIKVWKCNEGKEPWTIDFEYEANDISFGLWHFGTRVLVIGTTTGDIFMFKIPSGDTKVLQGHNMRAECGQIFKDGVRLAAGYDDGSMKIWDMKTCTVIHNVPPGAQDIRVTDLTVHPENSLVVTGSTDGKVAMIATSTGKIVGQFETDPDLETMAFCSDPQKGYFAIGTLTGNVSIWDSSRQMVRHNCAKSTDDDGIGVTKLTWVKDELITGCLDGSIRIYDGKNGRIVAIYTGHRQEILDLCHNAQANIILTTSEDGTARIFKHVNKN